MPVERTEGGDVERWPLAPALRSESAIVGTAITINDEPHTIVGVLPAIV